jgi:hypothetical protein
MATPIKAAPVIDKSSEGCVYGGFGRAIFEETRQGENEDGNSQGGKADALSEEDEVRKEESPAQIATYLDQFMGRHESVLVVKHLLSPKECQGIISSCEALGFEDLKHLYREDYRNNTRVMVEDSSFMDTVFERLRPHLDRYAKESVRLVGPNDWNEDVPRGCNPRMRICKYDSDGVFKRHQDGKCVLRKKRLESYLTVMVYLNDVSDADGGATRFYGRGEDSSDWQVCEQVQPRAGTAVVFPHSLSHDGELCNARKYILRSDVLFEMDVRDDEW